MIWEVEYTQSALLDLQNIYDYIADILLEPSISQKQTDRIMEAAESLEYMPFRHQLYSNEPWRSLGWRFIPVDNYIILYLPDEPSNTVNIMRIVYGGRNIENNI